MKFTNFWFNFTMIDDNLQNKKYNYQLETFSFSSEMNSLLIERIKQLKIIV